MHLYNEEANEGSEDEEEDTVEPVSASNTDGENPFESNNSEAARSSLNS